MFELTILNARCQTCAGLLYAHCPTCASRLYKKCLLSVLTGLATGFVHEFLKLVLDNATDPLNHGAFHMLIHHLKG